MNSKTKILIGVLVIGFLIGGWLIWSNQNKASDKISITTDKTTYSSNELIAFNIENRLEQSIYLNPVFSVMGEYLAKGSGENEAQWTPVRTTIDMPCVCFPKVTCNEKGFSPTAEIKRFESYALVMSPDCFNFQHSSEDPTKYRLEVRFFDGNRSMDASSPLAYSNEFIIK